MNEEDKKPRILVVGAGTHAETLRSVLAQNAHRLGAVPEVVVKDSITGEVIESEVVETEDGTAIRILEPVFGRHVNISSAVAQILAAEATQSGGEDDYRQNKHDRRRRWWEVSKRDRKR